MSYFNSSLVGIERVPPEPSACLIVLHGLAEHCGRYEATLAAIAAVDIACFAYDQRGHGRSPGARADIEHFSQFADVGPMRHRRRSARRVAYYGDSARGGWQSMVAVPAALGIWVSVSGRD